MGKDKFLYVPKLKNTVIFQYIGSNKWIIKSIKKSYIITGKFGEFLAKILPLLDGKHDDISISKRISSDRYFTKTIISFLSRNGFVENETHRWPAFFHLSEQRLYKHNVNFFSEFYTNKYVPQEKLKKAKITMFGFGEIGYRVLNSLIRLGAGNIKIIYSERGQDKYKRPIPDRAFINLEFIKLNKSLDSLIDRERDLVIVCTDIYEPSLCRSINKISMARGIRWTSCAIDGALGRIGPSVFPFETACFECYSLWRDINDYPETESQHKILNSIDDVYYYGVPYIFFPYADIIVNLFALEILRLLIAYEAPLTYNHELLFDLSLFTMKSYRIFKNPHCSICGLNNLL